MRRASTCFTLLPTPGAMKVIQPRLLLSGADSKYNVAEVPFTLPYWLPRRPPNSPWSWCMTLFPLLRTPGMKLNKGLIFGSPANASFRRSWTFAWPRSTCGQSVPSKSLSREAASVSEIKPSRTLMEDRHALLKSSAEEAAQRAPSAKRQRAIFIRLRPSALLSVWDFKT